MSIKNIVSLALVLSFLMISCIPIDKTVGDRFVEDYILRVDTASFDLDLISKVPEKIQSLSYSYMLVGSIARPGFGTTTSGSAVEIIPLSDSSDLGDNPEFTSISLRLIVGNTTNYSQEYEGIAQNIYVYELIDTISSTQIFNTSITTDDYNPIPIHVGTPVYNGGDTIGITLSEEFGKKFLDLKTEDFKDFNEFRKKINGLYITTDPIQEEGGRLNYLSIGSSTITLKYKITDIDQELDRRDTAEFFAVGYYALNQVKSGSADLASSDELAKTIYIDGFSGVKPYLNGVNLKAQIDKRIKEIKEENDTPESSIIVSKASINLPYTVPDNYLLIDERYPKFIYPCIIDSMEYFQPLEDIYFSTNIGENNRSLLTYPSDITSYIQDLIEKEEATSSDDLWFSSVYSQEDQYGASVYFFDDQSYYNGSINGPGAENGSDGKERKPTLSLVFTIVAD